MSWSVGAGLEGRGVLVTGAAGGIGRAVVEAFASAGARVMAVDVQREAVEDLVRTLPGSGHLAVSTNLRDIATHNGLVEQARSAFGELYVLAHLAAVLRRRAAIDEVTEDEWDLQLDVNLKASFFLCRAAANAMRAQGRGGRIILFASQGWWTGGYGGSVVYSASKGGVVSLARGLARTYGRHGITVNTVAPGLVDTSMLTDGLQPGVLDDLVASTMVGRIAEPREIAGSVVFLASEHASYITGATLNVSGGLLAY